MKRVGTELEKVPDSGKDDSKLVKKSTRAVSGTNSKLKIVKNKNNNGRIVIVMSKYMENGKQLEGAVEKPTLSEKSSSENGFHKDMEASKPAERSGPNRCHSEPCNRRDSLSFLSCRSFSAPNASSSPDQSNGALNGHSGPTPDSCQDEPMDLSLAGSRGTSNALRDRDAETPSSTQEPERVASFTSFPGNIIITDVTTNCLTVTFKEYVSV